MARRVARIARARPKQYFDWARLVFTSQTTVAANTNVHVATASNFLGRDITLYRTIIHMWVQSDQSAAVENQLGALGCFLANDNAISVGATALLAPVTDRDDDAWFFWQGFTQSSDLGGDAPTGYMYHQDSKVRRRMESGRSVAFMVENASASNGLQVALAVSMLARVA
mgnify:CR=1 FL=1